jgi:hypothetical protein
MVVIESVDTTWRVDITGKTVGLLSNGKTNSVELLTAVEKRLRERYGAADVIWANKTLEGEGPGLPAPLDIIERMSSGAVAVLVASGD